MQASCPQCAQRIVVDDARVPERPFAVRCPKCQAAVRLPGRPPAAPSATPPAAPSATASSAAGSADPTPADAGAALGAEARSAVIAQLRREMAQADGGAGRQVLVALPDRAMAGSLTLPLTRLGYTVEVLDRLEEGGRMLEDGHFDVVVTSQAADAPGRPETVYQRMGRLPPHARRLIFLILVGDEYKTGDGLQAFTAQADLVVNTRDMATSEAPLLNAMAERKRLYHAYLDARRRQEASSD